MSTEVSTEVRGADVSIFGSAQSFQDAQRIAVTISSSDLVPEMYKEKGDKKGIANTLLAMEIAHRLKMSPFFVMQNMDIIEGRPGWKSTYAIASVNASGRFGTLRFKIEDEGMVDVEYTHWEDTDEKWPNGKPKKRATQKKTKIQNLTCYAYAVDKETGETVEGEKISIEMAVKEGWYFRKGSKWPTMPKQMLQYRAGKFFANLYVPNAMIGMPTSDELIDSTEHDEVIIQQAPTQPSPTTSANEKLKKKASGKKPEKESPAPATAQPAVVIEETEDNGIM